MIHPSAHVDPAARLGKDVRVGAGAVVDAGCIVGDGCEIRAHAVVTGGTVLGQGNQVGYGAILGAEPQDHAYKADPENPSRLVIGDHNVIREYATLHRGTKPGSETRVGSHNFLMTGCHVGHNCRIGDRATIVNNVLLAGYVEVQDRAFMGGGAVVHQFVRIGELAIVRGGSAVGKDVPPYCMSPELNQVSGLNRVGLRRAGLPESARRNIFRAFSLLYRQGLNVTQALERIEADLEGAEIGKLLAFIRESKRGICKAYQRGGAKLETADTD
ncbi:MAG: acyl-ACP--UDP-N-acetylglucosamine O-acyltransferase [Verrucomicrobium sp.]|nr:acyl-ACP--UDP-N-acetylglucosamine O-acyltransferase [Verrucomicrobium sp.]